MLQNTRKRKPGLSANRPSNNWAQLGNTKSDRGPLREPFITKFKLQFKRGFTKVVVTRAGRLREWSQGELRLYLAKTQF